jgi:flagellum-specific ATP synthase
MMEGAFERAHAAVRASSNFEICGVVTDVRGLIIEGSGPFVSVGSQVMVGNGPTSVPAQVVGFKTDRVLLMPFGEIHGVSPGSTITAGENRSDVVASESLLGRVIDALGNPIDGLPMPIMDEMVPLYREPPNPVSRTRISECFDLGVRAMNGLLTVGQGQRVAIMAGSGVGKSTLLGMVSKHSSSDVNVIGLIGERGREVREFIERDLGPEGLARSVVVVATGNQPALLRIRAAFMATALAEFFRDKGKKVVLMLDSITRLAMAQREVGLAVGEPPSTRGYTPSVFSILPKLLERAGTCEGPGSITGLYTVLVEGDDMNEPVADTVRGILDGHVVLSRKLAGRGHFPAIDVLQSISRVMSDIIPKEGMQIAAAIREIIAAYQDAEDLITIGAYKPGQNARVDRAVEKIDAVNQFLKQSSDEPTSLQDTWQMMANILNS